MKQTFILAHDMARRRAQEAVKNAPDGYCVIVREATRSLTQNSLLWALLTELSEQVIWHGQKLEPESWKHVLTAGLKKQRVVPGIDGGFVVLGQSTSRMTKKEFSELVEFIYWFGAEQGVTFSDATSQTQR